MPPDNGSDRDTETAASASRRGVRWTPDAAESVDIAAVAAFLRALASRVERDPAFGRQIVALLAESGLLATVADLSPQPPPRRGEGESKAPPRRGAPSPRATASPPLAGEGPGERSDPFALLRDRGEAHLRAHLTALDLPALRQIVRVHRLDPARISARWTNRDRLVALIVDQVRARADHGKAFSRV